MKKTYFSEIIEKALSKAESMAKTKNRQTSQFDVLLALIEDANSIASKTLAPYKEKLKALSESTKEENPDQVLSDLQEWLENAQTEAIQSNREQVKEDDLLSFVEQHTKQQKQKLEDVAKAQESFLQFAEQIKMDEKTSQNTKTAIRQEISKMLDDGKPTYLEVLTCQEDVVENEGELSQLVAYLNRTDKNNVLIYGEKGVGKTSLVKSLVKRIEQEKVPQFLSKKRVYSLNVAAMILNVHDRREVANKIEDVLKFIKKDNDNKILFISNLENVLTENTLVYDNLKYYILHNDINVILETDFNGYNKVKQDVSLIDQMNVVFYKEPSIEQTINILEKVVSQYEIRSGVTIPLETTSLIVELAAKQITGKYLPQKALDVLDLSCANLTLKLELPSNEEVKISNTITKMQVASKYQKEKNVDEVEKLQSDLLSLQQKRQDLLDKTKKNTSLKNKLVELEKMIEGSESVSDSILSDRQELMKEIDQNKMATTLGIMDVCEVVSRLTDIPKEKLAQSKQENILKIGNDLKQQVYGQDESVDKISDTLISSYAGLNADQKPIGSFLCTGPSGVGKTEIAKALARVLFGNEKSMIRFDLSEYSEKHAVAKLIGPPPGYVGYEDGGVLTEAVRKNPYSVILFDEVEKAHPDFTTLFLQVLDDGRLTDNKGRTVFFNNTVIVFTTNAKDLKAQFRPEVLGRFNQVLQFQPLSPQVLDLVLKKELKTLNSKIKKQDLQIEITESMREYLVNFPYDGSLGARPLINKFGVTVNMPLSKQILSGALQRGKAVVDWVNNDVVFKNKE